jgi:hypothetical protein
VRRSIGRSAANDLSACLLSQVIRTSSPIAILGKSAQRPNARLVNLASIKIRLPTGILDRRLQSPASGPSSSGYPAIVKHYLFESLTALPSCSCSATSSARRMACSSSVSRNGFSIAMASGLCARTPLISPLMNRCGTKPAPRI